MARAKPRVFQKMRAKVVRRDYRISIILHRPGIRSGLPKSSNTTSDASVDGETKSPCGP